MSRIAGMRLTNFGRFRGDHPIDLGPGVWAIVARAETDGRKSNWSGKTTLLFAIRWCLFGALGGAWTTADSVISTGEKTAAVDLELVDGTFITRSKQRGQSGQLRMIVPMPDGTERQLAQDVAQAEIVTRLGMSLVDFDNTVWLGQKAMARLIRSDPAERTRVVSDWLDLGKLEAACKSVEAKLTIAKRKQGQAAVEHTRVVELCKAERAGLVKAVDTAEQNVAWIRESDKKRQAAQIELTKWQASNKAVTALDAAVAESIRIDKAKPVQVATETLEAAELAKTFAQSGFDAAHTEVLRLVALSSGYFDGRCPITCSKCPVSETVINSKAEIDRALLKARESKTLQSDVLDLAKAKAKALQDQHAAWLRWGESLKTAMERERVLKSQVTPGVSRVAPVVPEPVGFIESAVRTAADAGAALKAYDAAATRTGEVAAELAQYDREVRILQIAIRILGKGGAQRRIATTALAAIQGIANSILNESDIGMSVQIDYGRELQEIAVVCECGTAFPRSTSIRVCENCGAVRGKKRDEKLYINLSTVSGAAEDLAGIAIQLAAARWRRAARGARWSVVALDEPFGALDAFNRKALAGALAELAGGGFEQAFVVAHSDDILEAIPNRLVITTTGAWSRVEVG
jgi:hypothetical protein